MSVLIKGIDLPEAYTSAWLTVFECVGEHTFMKTHKVSAEQIQAIPPHGPLIDGIDLLKAITENAYIIHHGHNEVEYGMSCFGIMQAIGEAPTIIEAEEGKNTCV